MWQRFPAKRDGVCGMQSDRIDDRSSFNTAVSAVLRETAELLKQQEANPFRVSAYRRAAETVDSLEIDLRDLTRREGLEGLTQLPFIGSGMAAAIEEIARTGRYSQLDRLRGSVEPEKLFQTVPGIGPELARAIHESLHVDTLEALELATHDRRLEQVPGVGCRRARAIAASLASILGRPVGLRRRSGGGPDVETLLSVDREYLAKAAAGQLPTIAPRRFNPEGESWLPVLHASRDDWHFTVLFSNTARAHELGKTHDWAVIYFYDGNHLEGQHTVVSETHGPLKGLRVVRGREADCRRFYKERSRTGDIEVSA